LHDVYQGAESICKRIARDLDGYVPGSGSSHSDLLDQMANPFPGKRSVKGIEIETKRKLDDYRGFRHVFAHTYGFELKWEKMKPLLDAANPTINAFAEDIRKFIAFLRMISDQDASDE
jgi:uncharacterized protein YutE (UPF0331/DUF86 family)